MTARLVRVAALLAASFAFTSPSFAHEVRPGYLEIKQAEPDTFSALWKVPARGDLRLSLHVVLPEECRTVGESVRYATGTAFIDRWTFSSPGGLAGKTIAIEGLSSTLTDVLVRIEWLDGVTHVVRLTPASPSFVVEAAPGVLAVARTYLVLGVEHILFGIDHLLFVLALLILVRGWRRLIETITAFTVAHSVTLAAATLGFVHVPQAPVEAVIALSIVFVASEIVHGLEGRPGLTARKPWVVAFVFGLMHGFGFAGALSEVGLPQQAVPVALLLFNVGVEVGQLLFIAIVIGALFALRRAAVWAKERALAPGTDPLTGSTWLELASAYAIGSIAVYWVLERSYGFWSAAA